MKKLFFAFVATSVVVLSACNNKPADAAADAAAVVDSAAAVVESAAAVVDSAAVVVDSAAAKVAETK